MHFELRISKQSMYKCEILTLPRNPDKNKQTDKRASFFPKYWVQASSQMHLLGQTVLNFEQTHGIIKRIIMNSLT